MALITEIREADISEKLAVISLIIKVGQYIGEAYGYKQRYPALFDLASFLSMFLFGISIVLWLRSSRKELEKLDGVAKRVEDIKAELDRVDLFARYGSGPVHLANLLRAKTQAYGHAGGETLSEVLLRVYARAAQDLHDLTRGSTDRVEFTEYHVVDKFLLNLMKVLPDGSAWLGVTRLQSADAWAKDSAEPAYFEFQELVERRTKLNEISYFRLWCFDDESRQVQMRDILHLQDSAGVQTRAVVSMTAPDMSLIWVPKEPDRKQGARQSLEKLFPKLMESGDFEPLCAIEFRARGGKELDSMIIHGPDAERFTQLRILFKRTWDKAIDTAPAIKSDAVPIRNL